MFSSYRIIILLSHQKEIRLPRIKIYMKNLIYRTIKTGLKNLESPKDLEILF